MTHTSESNNADRPRGPAKVLLAIPVYNEHQHLNAVLDAVSCYVDDVVVIDDGSTDDTKLLLAQRNDVCVITHPNNRGYGQAIIDALQFARGQGFDWVITMDCDLQHEPANIPDFLAAIAADNADLISGSRYLAVEPGCDCPPPDRRDINHTITEMLNNDLDLGLTDAFCGFKAYRLSAMAALKLTESGYALPLEFWVESARHQLRIREIPVCLIYNDPNRCFGGELDDAQVRLRHYQQVYQRSLARAALTLPHRRTRIATIDAPSRPATPVHE